MSAYISARDALSKGSRKSRRAAQSQSSATGPAPFGDSGLTFVAAAVVAEAGARGFGAPCAKSVQSQSQAAMPTANAPPHRSFSGGRFRHSTPDGGVPSVPGSIEGLQP